MPTKKAEQTRDPKASATTNLEQKKEAEKSASSTEDARKRKEATSVASKLESLVKEKEGKKYRVVEGGESTLKILDQGKESFRNAIEEVKVDVSRYTQVVKDFQEMVIQYAKEVSDAIIESEKQIMHSMPMLWVQNLESPSRWIWNYWMPHPDVVRMYMFMAMTSAHGAFAANRLANNIVLTNMEAVRTLMTQFKDNVNELTNLIPGTAKAFGQPRHT
jgi:chemotaxis protein histidine kinase CheA